MGTRQMMCLKPENGGRGVNCVHSKCAEYSGPFSLGYTAHIPKVKQVQNLKHE